MPSAPRPISEAEFDAYFATISQAFGGSVDTAERDVDRRLVEYDRTLAIFDDGRPVATAGAFSLDLTVPGGAVPTAGVTMVSVLPTHRRRGLLSELMRRQLTDVAERGREPLMALWASEPAIYGRYGYGVASTALHVVVERPHAAFTAAPSVAGQLRLVEPVDAIGQIAGVYDTVRVRRPGFYARTAAFWDFRVFDSPRDRGGRSPLACVVHDGPDGVDGYALYATKQDWSEGGPGGTTTVREIVAASPGAHARLWRYLLDLDLMSRTEAWVATDDPLLHLLTDARRAVPRVNVNLFVRVVDVPRALAARAYSAPVDVVLAVSDDVWPAAAGRFRLAADPTGATCEPTGARADLVLPVRALGAAYLGGPRLGSLAAAGLVEECTPGALRAASTALSWDPAPFCPQVF